MRKAMWKKGLSVAMAAAMLTGTVTVPAVFNNSAIVKAAGDEQQKGMPEAPKSNNGMIYATVNMEYADFFYGELNNTAVGTSTTLDLSKDLLADYRAEGMYDAVTSATSKKSTIYATSYYETGVKNDETETIGKDGEISNTNLYGIKEVRIAIPEALYKNLYDAQKDGEYKNNKIYEYLNNATYSDTAFDTEYKVLNADGTFSKMITKEGTVEDKDALPVLATSTKWGDYEIDIENLGVDRIDATKDNGVDRIDATKDNMYGIILTDEKGNNYGLLHSDNTYKKTQKFAWAVNDVFSVHGNKVPYQRTNGLNEGNTVKKITYLLKDSADIVINTDIKLKKLIDTDKVNGSAETNPATTTEVKQTTTTVAKPVTKVTVKKQKAKVKAGKKKLTIRWKKDKAVSGYQIKLATKKNFKGAKTYTVKSYKTYKKVIKKLKSKKKYYVKVRAYKTVGKSKVYGAYSSVKSCKVK